MTTSVWWQEESDSEGTRLKMFGDITEAADLSPLLSISATTVILDLQGVRRINSSGVRQWVQFINGLGKGGRRIVFDRCSVAIVHQLNMVSSFRGNAQIRSVYAPYVCTDCGKDDARLTQVEASTPLVPEGVACSACGAAMEFDDLPEVYFSFQGNRTGGVRA
jgi:hypothetical protein